MTCFSLSPLWWLRARASRRRPSCQCMWRPRMNSCFTCMRRSSRLQPRGPHPYSSGVRGTVQRDLWLWREGRSGWSIISVKMTDECDQKYEHGMGKRLNEWRDHHRQKITLSCLLIFGSAPEYGHSYSLSDLSEQQRRYKGRHWQCYRHTGGECRTHCRLWLLLSCAIYECGDVYFRECLLEWERMHPPLSSLPTMTPMGWPRWVIRLI